jgi:hypothetical protein
MSTVAEWLTCVATEFRLSIGPWRTRRGRGTLWRSRDRGAAERPVSTDVTATAVRCPFPLGDGGAARNEAHRPVAHGVGATATPRGGPPGSRSRSGRHPAEPRDLQPGCPRRRPTGLRPDHRSIPGLKIIPVCSRRHVREYWAQPIRRSGCRRRRVAARPGGALRLREPARWAAPGGPVGPGARTVEI